MTDHDPTQPTDALGRANPRTAPDEVWERVREDYTTGLSATTCAARHGVGVTSLRNRAAREGWRRSDMPWIPPNPLEPWDEGVQLEAEIGGDLDYVELPQLAFVADRRMMRAVMRGQAADAMRWRRVRQMLEADQLEFEREKAQEAALHYWLHGEDEGPRVEPVDPVDGVPEDGADRP